MKKILLTLFLSLIGVYAFCANDITIIANRGYSAYYPENTIKAFKETLELKNNILIKTQLQLTKDDNIVCCCDKTIDRTSNAQGNIRNKSLAELKGYDFSYYNKFNGKFKGEAIPTLMDLIKLIKNNKAKFIFEIKDIEIIEPTLKILKENKVNRSSVIFLISNKDLCQKIISISKDYNIYFVEEMTDFINNSNRDEYFKNLKKDYIKGFILDYTKFLSMEEMDRNVFLLLAAKFKMPVGVGTIDSTSDILKIINYKVDGTIGKKKYKGKISMVVTNDPAKVILLKK